MNSNTNTLFPTGQVVATPGALEALKTNGQSSFEFLHRHRAGNYGDICKDDVNANEQALIHGSRILSSYHLKDQTKIWIITEADRSSTCVLLASEY